MKHSDLKYETSRQLLRSGIQTNNSDRVCCALIGMMTLEMFDHGMTPDEVIIRIKKVRDNFNEMTETFIKTLK